MTEKNRLDRYWRLNEYEDHSLSELQAIVEKAGYVLGKKASRVVLMRKLHRIERQQIAYDKCSTRELQKFLTARGLKFREKRSTAIQVLENVDKTLTFPKFLDLPPELRNRVYDFYFAEIHDILRPGTQPPLTRTCSLIRTETLKLFYSTKTFEFRIYAVCRGMQMLCRPTLEVELFLAKISEQNLRDLRKLSIRAEVRSDSPWREGERKGLCAVSCEIDIQQTGVKVKINGRASQGLVERRQVEANNLKLKIIDAATSGPSLGLGSKDFYDIRVGIAALVQ